MHDIQADLHPSPGCRVRLERLHKKTILKLVVVVAALRISPDRLRI